MRVLHIISSLRRSSGGPVRSSQGLAAALSACGCDVRLLSLSPGDENAKGNVDWLAHAERNGFFGAAKALHEVLAGFMPELVHVHGIWSMHTHLSCLAAWNRNIPFIVAPRGMLEPWSLNAKRFKKRLALWLYQGRNLRRAVALHATAVSEAEQLRRLGYVQPIIISPNGVDLPGDMPPRARRPDGKRTLLFLSRIHPKKGLLELVEAWAALKSDKVARPGSGDCETRSWHVQYAGPDYGGHLRVVRRRIRELGLENDFTYLGELSDAGKWQRYRNADMFVLPSFSENFGIVVAEALAAGLPVITTKGAPWPELSGARRCGWWIDIGRGPLVAALREAILLTDEERSRIGENGRALVKGKYTWDAIAKKLMGAYERVLTNDYARGTEDIDDAFYIRP